MGTQFIKSGCAGALLAAAMLAGCTTKDPVIGADKVFDVTEDYDMIVRCYADFKTLGEAASKVDDPSMDMIEAQMMVDLSLFRPIADHAIHATSFEAFREAWAGYGDDWITRIDARSIKPLKRDAFRRMVKETKACENQMQLWRATLPPPPMVLPDTPELKELKELLAPDPAKTQR